jgi:hypothetical protein
MHAHTNEPSLVFQYSFLSHSSLTSRAFNRLLSPSSLLSSFSFLLLFLLFFSFFVALAPLPNPSPRLREAVARLRAAWSLAGWKGRRERKVKLT